MADPRLNRSNSRHQRLDAIELAFCPAGVIPTAPAGIQSSISLLPCAAKLMRLIESSQDYLSDK
jgi:hypothetical protein